MDAPPITSEMEARAARIFFPRAVKQRDALKANGTRLVHYTSAAAAVSILEKAEIWMRKSTCMVDYSEIEHGWGCTRQAYSSDVGERLKSLVEKLYPGLMREFEQVFNNSLAVIRTDTYLTCLSEHGTLGHRADDGPDPEDRIGRLSMWRSFGDAGGVALVLNNGPFLSESQALGVIASPVAYLGPELFYREFMTVVDNIDREVAFVGSLGYDLTKQLIYNMFRFGVVATKHPGFHEEREWRVIFSPKHDHSDYVRPTVELVHGVPQPICKIPLHDIAPDLVGVNVADFLERVIIGPARYPVAVAEAIQMTLEEKKVPNAAERIFVSNMPLRW